MAFLVVAEMTDIEFAERRNEVVPTYDARRYRKCPVCRAETGEPCMVRSGHVVDGRPDGVPVVSNRPHIARKLRTGGKVDAELLAPRQA